MEYEVVLPDACASCPLKSGCEYQKIQRISNPLDRNAEESPMLGDNVYIVECDYGTTVVFIPLSSTNDSPQS